MRLHGSIAGALCALLGLVALVDFANALRDVRVRVPHAVRRGERAVLKCLYDIEDDSLYSVKWYKGRREFYRYTPKENPAMKVFQFPGVKVERYSSNESQLVLDAVSMSTAGKYSCEVSADAPSFHTLIAAAELDVVEAPHNSPVISGIRPRYRIGDILRGNCTSRHSRPAANLTWSVNNEEVNPSHVRHHKILRDLRNDMETAIIGIHFVVTSQHFAHGRLKLRCSAHIHDVYRKFAEKSIDEDHHSNSNHNNNNNNNNKYSATNSVNMVHSGEPYDQYALQDGDLLRKKDTYLTQIQDFLFHFVPSGDASTSLSASSGASTRHAPLLLARSLPPSTPTLLLLLLLGGWTVGELLLRTNSNQNTAWGRPRTPTAAPPTTTPPSRTLSSSMQSSVRSGQPAGSGDRGPDACRRPLKCET